jgi:hypothetical protein
MTEKIKGKIDKTWQKLASNNQMMHFVRLKDDSVYSGFGDLPTDLKGADGADIEIDYEQSGNYRNMKGYTVTITAAQLKGGTNEKPARIREPADLGFGAALKEADRLLQPYAAKYPMTSDTLFKTAYTLFRGGDE